MTSDNLRRAAAHVRYLAGDPAEWDMDTNNLVTFEVHERDERGWWSRLIGRSLRPTRALHVAAWNPKTARLVADWLDQHAAAHDTYDCQWEETACAALKTARALLNHPEEN